MSKILITGMSAPQASADANRRSLSFAGLMSAVLTQQGHDVVQADPEVSWTIEDLSEYDSVMVGISPLTSLSANRIYGALSVIDILLDSEKLVLFIDAPEPTKITSSLRAMIKSPQNMTKPFYSYRKDYSYATMPNVLSSLLDVVHYLLNEKWPTTIYPSLPWSGTGKIISQLPVGASESIQGINLDSYLITNQDTLEVEPREPKWVVENYLTTWTKSTSATLSLSTLPMKWHKGWSDTDVQTQISRCVGALISPYPTSGTWWSYRLVQCLNVLTPVATDWRESGTLGPAWLHLAASIEEMTDEQRYQLAKDQREAYASAVPSRREAAIDLTDLLQLYTRRA